MRVMLGAPTVRRAGFRASLTAALLLASGASYQALAQQPPQPGQPGQPGQPADPAQPAAPQMEQPEAPQPPQLTFDSDYVIWFYAVQGGRSADFEKFFGRVREAMSKSERPERRAQAQGMKLLKSTSAAPDGTETYVLMINPVSKGQEYSPGMLLFEVFPSEAKELVDELQGLINEKGLNAAVPMNTVMQLGGM
jgi:hypothetical protein